MLILLRLIKMSGIAGCLGYGCSFASGSTSEGQRPMKLTLSIAKTRGRSPLLPKLAESRPPGERGTATTERAGLQPGQLVAAARTAEQDQELVADELATQVDEDRRSAGQARAVLLAAAGRRAFEPQAVRRHAAQDVGAAAAKRVALTGRGATVFGYQRFRKEQCRPERRSARSINVCERMDEPWRLPAEVMCRVQRENTWYSGQRGCILSPCQGQNGNPGVGYPLDL